MKIRRLEIQGFKSFADRTVLTFGEGITGVVGPNGCGKSNIVDAIRWVMGEQSAKHLRGLGMQDVIFAGCEARGPGGMAEVTLSFANDGNFLPPEYAQHEEIQVTRRLYRDGTSEYLINQVQSRLRDILDLFMGTGIGRNAYAIIEQGRIGMVVTARPEERRTLIEDAAGVSRYKTRKRQAERRIAAAEQNLARVNDLVSELANRLRTLKDQAEKAERYKSLKAELKELDLHAASHRFLDLRARADFSARQKDELFEKLSEDQAALSFQEELIHKEEAGLSTAELSLREAEAEAHEKKGQLDLGRQNLEFLSREKASLEERLSEVKAERARLVEDQGKLEGERKRLTTLSESLGSDASEEVRRLEAREVAKNALMEELQAARDDQERFRAELFEHRNALTERNAALENLGRRSEDLEGRLAVESEQRAASQARVSELEKQIQKMERQLAESRQLELTLGQERESVEAELKDLEQADRKLGETVSSLREKLVDTKTRFRSLQRIQKNYEGCSEAVQAIMTEPGPGMHGLVADVLRAEPRFETAVEAVLGERLQSIVVSETGDGFRGGEQLRSEEKGRSTFIPLDVRLDHAPWAPPLPGWGATLPPTAALPPTDEALSEPWAVPSSAPQSAQETITTRPPLAEASAELSPKAALAGELSPEATLPDDPTLKGPMVPAQGAPTSGLWLEHEEHGWPALDDKGVCGKMVDLVSTKPGYESVAEALLGDVLVVESFEKAHELWVNNGHRKTLVTLAGDVLDPMGVFTGGSSSGVSAGLLSQKRELSQLEREVQQLEARVKAAEHQRSELAPKVRAKKERQVSIASKTHEGALSIVAVERDIASLRDRLLAERTQTKRFEEALAMLRSDQSTLRLEIEATESAHADLLKRVEEANESTIAVADSIEILERKLSDLSDEVTGLKVDVAANRERQDHSQASLVQVLRQTREVESKLEALKESGEKSEADLSTMEDQRKVEATRLAELEPLVAASWADLHQRQDALEADRERLKLRQEELRELRGKTEQRQKKFSATELQSQKASIALETLCEQIDERYQVDLRSIVSTYHVRPPQTEEHEKRAKKLRKKLADMGPINLTAIEECQTVKERHAHLDQQKSDLEQAIEALRGAIERINKTSRARFVEAFDLVNEKFQQVFPKVFNGGQCSLVMTDRSDPLESGIEIMAQPPGKKLQSVNLLSGGEKALTAVSLIFGIFLIKPTPFCLLDEVDAPLDEANVGRYNDMLQEMAPISQFILITHNKRTMELPDRLYGVTMETPGISKIVPVDVRTTPEAKAS